MAVAKVRKNMVIGYSTGTFDLPHTQHFAVLKMMQQRCDYLIIGLSADDLCRKQKRNPIMSYEQRKAILEHCRYVDAVVHHTGDTKQVAWEKLKFDILFIGEDYFGKAEYAGFQASHPHVEVVYFPRSCYVNTSDFVGGLERRIIDDIQMLALGISGPVLQYRSKDTQVIIKPVAVGSTEYRDATHTGNAYQLPFPLPRNWRKQGDPMRHINIAGVNAVREIKIHEILKREWNPVYKTHQAFLFGREQKAEPVRADWTHITLERGRPQAVYWLFQHYSGIPLSQWIREEELKSDFVPRLKRICAQVWLYIKCMISQGIIHGDVHTDNLCVDTQEKVSVIDFGWCLHYSFHMEPDEKDYYERCLDNLFDWTHFCDAMEWAYSERSWWINHLGEFPDWLKELAKATKKAKIPETTKKGYEMPEIGYERPEIGYERPEIGYEKPEDPTIESTGSPDREPSLEPPRLSEE